MRKKLFPLSFILSIGFIGIISNVLISSNIDFLPSIRAENSNYELLFSSTKNKVYYEDTSSGDNVRKANIKTSNQNNISISFSNIKNKDNIWGIFENNGSLFNDIDSSFFKNCISGISSIYFSSSNDKDSLLFYPGYSLKNDEILYLNPITLKSNSLNILDSKCNYFKIKNESGSDILINTLKVNYDCTSANFPANNLKVLMIGNSFGDDTTYFADRIAKGYGVNLKVYNAYIAGCTIDQHYQNLLSNETLYSLRTMNNDAWNYEDNKSLREIILKHEYDVITFQQSIAQIGLSSSYSNLTNLVNGVKAIAKGNPRYMYHSIWAYDKAYMEPSTSTPTTFSAFNNSSKDMFKAIINNYKNIVEDVFPLSDTIFNSTAVENLRTSYLGNTFSRDSKHLSKIVGRYLAGLNFVTKILDINLFENKSFYKPDELSSYGYEAIKEAVNFSQQNPYNITNSTKTRSRISEYNILDYEEKDPGFIGNCYYDNTKSNEHDDYYYGNESGISNRSAITYRFTKNDLPVGTVIDVGESTSYKISSWHKDKSKSTSGFLYDSIIEISESFWNDYNYRAFTLYQKGNENEPLTGLFEKVFSNFHIYVPRSKTSTLNPRGYNSCSSLDQTKFSSHSLNINNFKRVELYPIIGFYHCQKYAELINSYVDDTAKQFVCTIPFFSCDNVLKEGTVLILDSNYQYRSDYWSSYGYTSTRPSPVQTEFSVLTSSFMENKRIRTFNVNCLTYSSRYVFQQAREFMNHFRIYTKIS